MNPHLRGADGTTPAHSRLDADTAWRLALAASQAAEELESTRQPATFGMGDDGGLRLLPSGHHDAVMTWQPGSGWELALPGSDPRHALLDLYLPICSATTARPMTIGHLGQSLDGFIATHSGESQYVTGEENILHLHRMRALCDAVVVGAGTIAADDPQLTTRHVAGPNPLRVVLDPARRLGTHYRVFHDDSAPTLYVCARSAVHDGASQVGHASLVAVGDGPAGMSTRELVDLLHARGCRRIFVEGGGITVSMFLEADLLDRLQMAIAPLIIGSGRPAIRVPPRSALRDCARPHYRVFRMGGDVLFDCELKWSARPAPLHESEPPITRVI